MATGTFEYSTEAERASIERLIAFASELHALAGTAEYGTALDACEGLALGKGRQAMLEALREAVQGRVDAADEKKGQPVNARAGAVSA